MDFTSLLSFYLSIETFEMINSCDPNLAGWTEDGTMFVIKEQAIFAQQIIPQFFDHNKFASFARQLNFYGFRKMQVRSSLRMFMFMFMSTPVCSHVHAHVFHAVKSNL